MADNYLKSKTVPIGDQTVTLTQLSGLARFDFIEYLAELERPETPVRPADDAPIDEKETYLEQFEKVVHQYRKLTFIGQSRLVAYGLMVPGEDIEQRHRYVMNNFTCEDVQTLHDEVAVFSGIPLNNTDESTQSSDEQGSDDSPQEPVGPKA